MSNFYLRRHRAVFIHIPKTGGISIRDGVFKGQYEGPSFGGIPDTWEYDIAFCFVRNPYDRLISAWKMFTEGTSRGGVENPGLTLEDFLRIVTDDRIVYDHRRSTYEERIRHHTIPQTHPFNCLQLADLIGRFESLQDDFDRICRRLKIGPVRLPVLNVSRHRQSMEYFSDESRCLVQEYYRQDFEQLGYPM